MSLSDFALVALAAAIGSIGGWVVGWFIANWLFDRTTEPEPEPEPERETVDTRTLSDAHTILYIPPETAQELREKMQKAKRRELHD